MKYYISLLFLGLYNLLYSQTTYFSDTLNTPPLPYEPYGFFVLPLQNGGCKIINQNINPGLMVIETNNTYSYIGSKIWALDSIPQQFVIGNQFAYLPSGNRIVSLWGSNADGEDWQHCYLKMNPNMDDTLTTAHYARPYNGIAGTSSTAGFLKTDTDGASFWATGSFNVPGQYNTPMLLSRLDTNFNVIFENILGPPNLRYVTNALLTRPNHRCIVAGTTTYSYGTGVDNIRVCAVNDAGEEWHKDYGNIYQRDAFAKLLHGPNDSTFWLVYTEGRSDTVGTSSNYPFIRIRIVLLTDSGTELMSRYLGHTSWRFTYHESALELPDGDFLFGFSQDILGIFQKYSRNFELLWESRTPIPNIAPVGRYGRVNPTHAARTPEGDFLCTGVYDYNGSPFMIWVGKMDSTGCWYDAGCTVGTEPSPLNLPLGDLINVFPNPTVGPVTLSVKLSAAQDVTIDIFAATGQAVASQTMRNVTSQNFDFDLSEMPSGMYFARIKAGDETKIVKITAITK